MTNARPADAADHPGVWVPPPLLYVGVFVLGVLLQRVLPLPGIPGVVGGILGTILIGAGAGLALWSIGLFRRKRTSPIPIRPTTTLVVTGPYRVTRNPMYLGLLFAYAGLAFFLGEIWPLLLLPLIILIVRAVVIEKEECYLERKFGVEYTAYKQRVRRWL